MPLSGINDASTRQAAYGAMTESAAAGLKDGRVTVGIPAYNAEATLDETLLSVRAQSYPDLEIIVVDDGSSDRTAAIARRHADTDPRITFVRQANGGVSSARNAALARASGALFAAIDADDLWHHDFVARQVRSIKDGAGAVVLSYTWYAYIDERGRVLSTAEPMDEGNVIARMCGGNLLGNGSSAVMVTSVLRQVGGWDPHLRGGNEDYKTFFLMAERGNFAVVRSHLLGYRKLRGNRSSQARPMLTTFDQVVDEVRPRHLVYAGEFFAGRSALIAYLFDRAVLNWNWEAALYLLGEAWAHDRGSALAMLKKAPLIAGRLFVPLSFGALFQTPRSRSQPRKSAMFLAPSADR
jgi:glycosyltransferase involved in cell wall biosynthesis